MREKLELLTLDQLREMAKEKGLKVSGKVKSEIVNLLLETCEYEQAGGSFNRPPVIEGNGEMCSGIFEIVEEAKCGFIRSENFLPGINDVYVSSYQIRK